MHANYRQINPPEDTPKPEYTTAERRAELFDLIEQAGHYRNLQQSYRQLGDRYGVTKQMIRKDIVRVMEFLNDNLSPHAEAELETLKTKAVMELLDRGEVAKAYEIMSEHYDNLQSMGEKDEAANTTEVTADESVVEFLSRGGE